MRSIFTKYSIRLFLCLFLAFTILTALLAAGWQYAHQQKIHQEKAMIRPLLGEVVGHYIAKLQSSFNSYYIDSLHAEKNAFTDEGDHLYWRYKGKLYSRFLPADIEGVRSVTGGFYSDQVVPKSKYNYLLRFAESNSQKGTFMVRSALPPLTGYVVGEIDQGEIESFFTVKKTNGATIEAYLLSKDGRILFGSHGLENGEYVYSSFAEKYPSIVFDDLGVSAGSSGLRVGQNSEDYVYGVGWQDLRLGEKEYILVTIASYVDPAQHLFSYFSAYQAYLFGLILLLAFFLFAIPMWYLSVRERDFHEKFSAIFETMPSAVFVTDLDKNIIAWNRAMEALSGVSRKDMLGNHVRDIANIFGIPKDSKLILDCLDASPAVKKKELARYESFQDKGDSLVGSTRLVTPKGLRYTEVIANKLLNGQGKEVGFVQVMTDIHEHSQLLEEIKASKEQYQRVVDIASQGIWEWDKFTNSLYLSPRSKMLLGYKENEFDITLEQWSELLHPDDVKKVTSHYKTITKEQPHYEIEFRVLHRDGRYRWFLSRATGVWKGNSLTQIVGSNSDITDRKRNQLTFEVLYKVSMASYLNQGIGRYLEAVHEAVQQYTGVENFYVALWRPQKNRFEFIYDRDETGPALDNVLELEDGDLNRIPGLSGHVIRKAKSCLFTEDSPEMVKDCTGPKSRCWLGSPIKLDDKPIGLLAVQDYHYKDTFSEEDFFLLEAVGEQIARAIEREQVHEHLFYQASHDNLTGLVNREYFLDLGGRIINRQKRSERFHALLMLDLNRFKQINDSLGHAVGDEVLCDIAKKIQSQLRSTDTLARLGGDEFAILLEDGGTPAEVIQVVKRIIQEVEKGVVVDERSVATGVSVGVVVDINRYDDIQQVIRDADIAMYEAKYKSSRHFRVFNQVLYSKVQERIEIDYLLTNEFNPDDFSIVYQPVVDTEKQVIEGFEALVRWAPQKLGPLRPDQFLPVAEDTGIISKIDSLVLSKACKNLRDWRQESPLFKDLRISVNISQYELIDYDLAKRIIAKIERYGLDPQAIIVEVTETALMANHQVGSKVLRELRSFGIGIHIDDFGTGYSSLAHLADLPFDALKVDRSFLAEANESSQRRTVLETLVRMSDSLGIPAIAEGVETGDQLELITSLGCEYAQGYFFAAPLPQSEVMGFCENFYYGPNGKKEDV